MRLKGIMLIALAAALAGCDLFVLPPKSAPPTATSAAPATPAPPTLPSSGGILAPGSLEEMAAPVSSGTAGGPITAPPTDPNVQREVAGVGSGIKGRSLEKPGVVRTIAEPAVALFRTKERLVFEVQIPHDLQIYKALNDGKAPATHDEFMQNIIQEYQIKLPALPPGHKYVYDPATEQLMVEKPAR